MKRYVMATKWSVILVMKSFISSLTMKQGKILWMQFHTQKMKDGELKQSMGNGSITVQVVLKIGGDDDNNT